MPPVDTQIPYDQAGAAKPEVPASATKPEVDIGKIVQELLQRSKSASQEMRKKIGEDYGFYVQGKQWAVDRPSWRFNEVVNVSLGTLLQEVGIQTDGRPKVDYAPQEPTDVAFTQVLKELNDRNWGRSDLEGFGWPNKLEQHIFEVKYSPWSFAEICWDPTLEAPMGDIGWKKLDPSYCYFDPLATNIHDLRWFIYIQPTPTEILKVKYPDKKEEIKPDIHGVSTNSVNRDYNVDRQAMIQMLEGNHAPSFDKEDRYGGEKMTLLVRCWLRDSAVIEVIKEKELDDPDSQAVLETRLKYPKGRYVEMAGKTVLRDGANGVWIGDTCEPYEDGQFPIALLRNYSLPGKLEGLTESPFLKGPQKVLNYVWSFILDSMKMTSNPKVTVTPDAQDLIDQMTNEPGAVIPVPKQDSIMFHPGEGVAPGLMQILEEAKGLVTMAQGIQEVSKGASQPGVNSGLMMEGYVEASQTRPRLKNRNVDQFLGQIGYLTLSRVLQFYKAPRIFRLANPKEGWPEHLSFFVGDDGKGGKSLNITPMTYSQTTGQQVAGPMQTIPIKGIPDVIIQSGSALPYGRAQKQAMAMDQFKNGLIDPETTLTDLGRTDVKQVLARMEEMKAKEAEAQMAAQQGAAQ